MTTELIDVAIIGGGPAGLTAAATLARQLHTAVVFDSGSYRNAPSAHMHMVPAWDHRDPAEFRAATKRDILARYAEFIKFEDIRVENIEKVGDAHFKVRDASDENRDFRKIILAVGSSNVFPDIKGYEDVWGKRIFHCLFCHGFEDRGAPSAGILAIPPISAMTALVVHMGENAAQLSKSVTLYTHGDEEMATQLDPFADDTFKVERRPIERLTPGDDGKSVTVEFVDGSKKEETFLVHSPQTKTQGPFVDQLGLATTPTGDLVVKDATILETSVRGVFAAGDCSTMYKVMNGALSSGCNAAVMASIQLQAEKHGHQPMF